MVVDAGDDLQLRAVIQLDAAHHVHLPQLHGSLALEPAELVSTFATSAKLDQVVTAQAPVDARAAGHRIHAELRELVADPPRSPSRVLPTQLADLGLGLGIDLVGTGGRAMRPVGERGEPARLIACDPTRARFVATRRGVRQPR